MHPARILALTSLAMIAFAANSILGRLALRDSGIDAASFTAIRLISGALMLWFLVSISSKKQSGRGDWGSAIALLIYAAGFSFAYISLPTATGALILFGAVQSTMIGYGLYKGEFLGKFQIIGLALAVAGLVVLLLPGLSAPPLQGSLLMFGAGIAWGVYSLRGKSQNKNNGDPTQITAGNFLRAAPLAVLLPIFMLGGISINATGILYAIASGALASGMGYSIWYAALPALKSTTAATVQLSVPLLAALGGIIFLQEPISLRLALASLAILGGIALIVLEKSKNR